MTLNWSIFFVLWSWNLFHTNNMLIANFVLLTRVRQEMCSRIGPISLQTLQLMPLYFLHFSSWKSCSVVPIFKNNWGHTDPSKYHSISLLPQFGKVFESLVNAEMIKHLISWDLLSDKRPIADVLTAITDICISSSW